MGILEEWFLKVLQFVFMVLVGSMLFEKYRNTRDRYDLGWAASFGVIIIKQLLGVLSLGGLIYLGFRQVNFFYPVLDQTLLLVFYLCLVYTFYLERVKSEANIMRLGMATASGPVILFILMMYYWRPFAVNQISYGRFWGNMFFSIIHLSLVITISAFLYLREKGLLRTWRQTAFYSLVTGHVVYILGIVIARENIFLNILAGLLFFVGYLIFAFSVVGYRIQFKLIMLLIIAILLPTLFTIPLLSTEFKTSLINLGYKVFPIEEINQVTFSLKKLLYLISGMGILIASSLGYLLSAKTTGALRGLTAGVRKLGAGDLSARVELERKDEIGEISREFDNMAQKLEDKTNELVSTQRQIVQLEKISSIGRLAGGVAHEVNNPLTGVLGCSQLGKEIIEEMKDSHPDKELQKKLEILGGYFNTAETGSLRCKEITSSLLKFSRQMDAGKRERVKINDIIEMTLAITQIQPGFRFINIEKHFASNLSELSVNKSQIMQVFLELLLNAVHAMPDGGSLIIATAGEGDRVIIKFSDTGPGISMEEREKIFMPFYTTREVGEGKGLGLSISYGIIKAHNGTMDIESEEGKGTTISIGLPVKVNGEKLG